MSFKVLSILTSILAGLTVSAASGGELAFEEDYITPELFFWKALQVEFPGIQPGQVEVSDDLGAFTSNQIENFKTIYRYTNSENGHLVGSERLWKVALYGSNDGDPGQLICLGALNAIFSHLDLTDGDSQYELLSQVVDRTAFIYLSQCSFTEGERAHTLPINFDIGMYQAFPQERFLPISTHTPRERFLLMDSMNERRVFRCIDSDTNAHMEPRSTLDLYKVNGRYLVRSATSTSSPRDDGDVGVNFGALDLNSLDWAKENISFLKDMGGVVFAAFEEENCFEEHVSGQLVTLLCSMDVESREDNKYASEVSFHLSTQMRADVSGQNEVLRERLVYNVTVLLKTQRDEERNIYRYDFDYENLIGGGPECMQAPSKQENAKDPHKKVHPGWSI